MSVGHNPTLLPADIAEVPADDTAKDYDFGVEDFVDLPWAPLAEPKPHQDGSYLYTGRLQAVEDYVFNPGKFSRFRLCYPSDTWREPDDYSAYRYLTSLVRLICWFLSYCCRTGDETMKSVSTYEAKAHLSKLIAEIERTGKPVTICRNRQPVVDLVPHREVKDPLKQLRRLKGAKFHGDPCATVSEEDWPEELR